MQRFLLVNMSACQLKCERTHEPCGPYMPQSTQLVHSFTVNLTTSKHRVDAFNGCNEGIDFLESVVKCEADARSSEHTQAVHERLGTVMARANGYTETVEQRAPVHMMAVAELRPDDGIVA